MSSINTLEHRRAARILLIRRRCTKKWNLYSVGLCDMFSEGLTDNDPSFYI